MAEPPEVPSEPRASAATGRRAVFLVAAGVAAAILAAAGFRGALDPWLIAAAAAAVIAATLLGGRRRSAPAVAAASGGDERLAAADTLLDHVPDPVILVDRRAVVRQANAAARALLPALRLNHPLSFSLRAPDVLDGIATVVKTGSALKVEHRGRAPTERSFEVQIGPLRPGAGGARGEAGVVLFFRDQTSARRLEHLRVDFIANASHELRTPLATLLGFIETLQGPARDDPAARERFLEIMRGQARRMTRLIDDLLSLSRIELRAHLHPDTPVDLVAVLRQMIDSLTPLARERGVEIVFAAENEPQLVLGDRDELLRVAENLIDNAVKYGEDGKRVEVTLRPAPASAGRPAEAELAVRDYGPGIAPEHLPRLTERFFRADVTDSRQKGGTGLGLAIVKHILARHRGRLTIESEPGKGATFRAFIPRLPAPAQEPVQDHA